MPEAKTARKITKQTKTSLSDEFCSDIELDGMLCAVLIRSPQPAGKFISITHPELPEGYAIFTYKDLPGNNQIKTLGIATPIFCSRYVQYKGEPLGILAGPDEKTAHSLLSELHINIDTSDTEQDSPVILAHREIKTGLALTDKTAFEKLFKDAGAQEVSCTWSSAITMPSCSETNGAICFMQANQLHVYTPTQWLSHLRKTLSTALGINKGHIQIKKTKSVTPSSNGIWRNAIFATQTALAAVKMGKPVKLMLSRQEQQQYMENPIPVTISSRSAVNADGVLLAMQVSIHIDAGSKNPFAQEILDRLVIASCGIYDIENLDITATAIESRTPPSSLNIDTIDSQAFFAIECQIERIADISGIRPTDIRKRNIPGATGKKHVPFTFNTEHACETIDAVTAASDFLRKYVTYRLDSRYKSERRMSFTVPPRGIGMACAFDGSGYFGTNIYTTDQKMEATMEKDGSLTLHAMPPSAAILAIWKKTAADMLDINAVDVHINSVFETEEEPQLPESVYSNLSVMTQLLRKCCKAIQGKRFRQPLPITVKKRITAVQRKQWNSKAFCGTPFHSTSFAAAVIELELDPCTFREHVRNIWVAVDGGEILSEKNAENSIKLDIHKILSRLILDETVNCQNISLRFMPSASEPKQIHGLVQNILPAAFTSALSQALANTVTSIPLSPETIFKKGYYQELTHTREKTDDNSVDAE